MEKRFKSLTIQDIIVFSPKKIKDLRGIFFENFNFNEFLNINNYSFNTVQENISISRLNTLRGLHFQKGSSAQSKIINVI